MKMLVRFAILMVISLLGIGAGAQEQSKPGQIPLGDVVKQQKAGKKAKRVVTNDDIPQRPPEAAAPAAAEGTAATAQAAEDKGSNAGDAKSTAPKSADAQTREQKLTKLKDSEESAKRLIQKMEESLTEPDLTDNRRRMYEETLSHVRTQLEQIQKQRQELENQPAAKPGEAPK